jgi:hypothetical protein
MALVEKIRLNTGDSLVWFGDTFSRTQNILFRKSPDSPIDVPMIAFPVQEEFKRFVHGKIRAQQPWGSRKSRGFGLTWTVVDIFDYLWIADPNAMLLIASDKQDKVDSSKDPDAIMQKMDFHINGLPAWLKDEMLPGYVPRMGTTFRSNLAMKNPLTGATTIGSSTTGDMARGGRKTAAAVDESASIDELENVEASLFAVSKSTGYFSTDKGLARYFAQMWQAGAIEFFRGTAGARWQDNPMWCGVTTWPDGRKGKLMKDAEKLTGGVFVPGITYTCEPGECPIHKDGGGEHSDEYDEACKRCSFNRKKIAEELDMDPSTAGGSVFDVDRINRVIEYLNKAISSGEISWSNISLDWIVPQQVPKFTTEEEFYHERGKWNVRISNHQTGPVRVWKWPFSCRNPECVCGGSGKHVYSIGGDTSAGYATSDGAGACVLDCTAGEIVADVHGTFHPIHLAVEVIKLAKFYGTSSGDDINAYLAIESNGEGATVNRICDQHGMLLHLSKLSPDGRKKGKTRRLGVVVNTNKSDLLAHSIEKVINGGEGLWPLLVCPFPEYWYQMLTFIECAPNTKDQKAEKTRKAAQKGAKDDRVMMLNHSVHGAIEYYGNWFGILRPDEYRLKPVNFLLAKPLHNV